MVGLVKLASLGTALALASTLPNCHAEPPLILGCTPIPLSVDGTRVPADVDCNGNGNFEAFSDYGWRAFLAVSRESQWAERGEPNPRADVSSSRSPRVFETFKAPWELFRPAPSAWSERPAPYPCANVTDLGDTLALSSQTLLDDIHQLQSARVSGGPLVAQNGTYIRYGIGYNKIAYDTMKDHGWHKADQLLREAPARTMPPGAVVVKAAWMIVNSATRNPERYYSRAAWIRKVGGAPGECERAQVALIALHIIQKTPLSPQWIWTTFDHVDNVPPHPEDLPTQATSGSSGPYALHDASPQVRPMPKQNPLLGTPLTSSPRPQNVVRANRLAEATVAANLAYRAELRQRSSVWQHYQLVATQWPKALGVNGPGDVSSSIPGEYSSSEFLAYANPAIESYFQTPIKNGCMSCHDTTRLSSDFLWSPVLRASESAPASSQSRERQAVIQALENRLKGGGT